MLSVAVSSFIRLREKRGKAGIGPGLNDSLKQLQLFLGEICLNTHLSLSQQNKR